MSNRFYSRSRVLTWLLAEIEFAGGRMALFPDTVRRLASRLGSPGRFALQLAIARAEAAGMIEVRDGGSVTILKLIREAQ